ncbi:MAG: 2'-5' RNA ligase family protein [Candidatus Aenigmarchaeota archaeon]|nr:2'-5' RNA ligase family protein [Candidatus Aenigmarchaeota archaeon]
MSMAKGYSIWMMPTGDVYRKLSGIISELSSKYSAPKFEPHVTLLGELLESEDVVLSKTEQLSKTIKPFSIKLALVDYLDQYFRCLFLRAEETNYLTDANNNARELFNRQQDPKFMPHLSLMYGDFPTRLKDEIIRQLGKEFNVIFDVKSIHLVSTNNETKEWHRVKEFVLE